jgi:hypothetical protein
MSVHPVPTLSPVTDVLVGDAKPRVDVRAPSQPASAQPGPGKNPKKENPTLELSMAEPEIPRDEVQVQRVNGATGDIVIRYLDASGNLILQIPSSQLLGLAKAVDQALEQQANREAGGGGSWQPGQGELSDGR